MTHCRDHASPGDRHRARVGTVPEIGTVPVLTAEAAVAVARDLAAEFAGTSAERDLHRVLPAAEVERLSASGLLAITVPAEYGGADLPASTLAEVFRLLADRRPQRRPDPAQPLRLRQRAAPPGHPGAAGVLLRRGAGRQALRQRPVRGRHQARPRHPDDADPGLGATTGPDVAARRRQGLRHRRALRRTGSRSWPTSTPCPTPDGPLHVAWVERRRPRGHRHRRLGRDGPAHHGQRHRASWTTSRSTPSRITPFHLTFEGPQTYGAFAQLLHAAIDAGIARAALDDAAVFVRTKSRPYPDAGGRAGRRRPARRARASARWSSPVRGAEALLREAGRAVEARRRATSTTRPPGPPASRSPPPGRRRRRSSVDVGSRLFEVCGTRSALDRLNLDRHWRNARTHTLHDPAAWKVQHLGRYAVDGTLPPNHGQL